MIALINTSNNTTIAYFNNDMQIVEKIEKWVNDNIDHADLNLNESHSCKATSYKENGTFKIHISGDEDSRELELVQLDKIAITL